ncbi:MAG: glycosyltransferase family 2 protein [Patescibacteria group bacterium]
MDISLSIIVPALNEAKNIEAAIAGAKRSLAEANITNVEFLVMTCLDRDLKSDGTVDIVRKLAEQDPRIRSIHVDVYQKLGEKYRNAVRLATKEYSMMIPGDNENDPASFPVIFSNIGKADMVVSYTSNPEERPLYRRIISKTYTTCLNILFLHRMPYYNGINVYRSEDLRNALPQTDSFAYAAEILLTLLKQKKTYVVVPARVQFRFGKTKALGWNSLKSVIAAILRLRTRLAFKRPSSSGVESEDKG